MEEEIDESVGDTLHEEEPVVSSARESEASEPAEVVSDSDGIMVVRDPPARQRRKQAKVVRFLSL